jgi:hypothetical protein
MILAEMPLRLRLMGVRASAFHRATESGPLAPFLAKPSPQQDGPDMPSASPEQTGKVPMLECPVCMCRMRTTAAVMELHVNACLDHAAQHGTPPQLLGPVPAREDSPLVVLTPPPQPPPPPLAPSPAVVPAESTLPESECPVCQQRLRLGEAGMEAHVLACLQSASSVRRQVQAERQLSGAQSPKRPAPAAGKPKRGRTEGAGSIRAFLHPP